MFFRGEFRFLSNFFQSPVTMTLANDRDVEVLTVEHAYQASKTLVLAEQFNVIRMGKPGRAKREGRKITLRADWDDVKIQIMRMFVFQKFLRYGDLRRRLMKTPRPIIEDNKWHDNFWGRCLCDKCRSRFFGQNHLGKILMECQDFVQGV